MLPNPYLPEDVILVILSRLPVKSILRFKSVSKTWYALLTDPTFTATHLTARRTNSDQLLISTSLFCRHPPPNFPGSRSLFVYDVSSKTPLSSFPFISTDYVHVVGSCNGLVCLIGISKGPKTPTIVLRNPATRHFRYIHLHPLTKLSYDNSLAFGFIPDQDDYKIVEFQLGLVFVYTLSLDSWKSKRGSPAVPVGWNCAICMNGVLLSMGWEVVVSFDLRDEVFGQIALPDFSNFYYPIGKSIVVLQGYLSLIVNFRAREIEKCYQIWVMTQYGVEKSWTKVYNFRPFSIPSHVASHRSWRNGQIIFQQQSSELFSYDPSIGTAEYLRLPGSLGLARVFNYVESLESVEGGKKRNSRGCSFMTGYLGIEASSEKPGEDETPRNGRDIGWKFAIAVPNDRRRLHCRLCGRLFFRGITRLKQHLAHQGRGVSPCPYVSADIREQMMKHLLEVFFKEKQNTERDVANRIRLFPLPDEDFDDEDDDDDDDDDDSGFVLTTDAKLLKEMEKRERLEAEAGAEYDVGGSS